MDKLKTIGEVERLTGIPKRTLKYYIERSFIVPSRKSDGGYWLYSDSDIKRVQRIDLYHTLGYPDAKVKSLLEDSDFDWQKALDTQISELKEQRRHINRLLYAAEIMRFTDKDDEQAIDISFFDGSIDSFIQNSVWPELFSLQKAKDLQEPLSAFRAAAEVTGQESFLWKLLELTEQPPDSPAVQEQIEICFHQFKPLGAVTPEQILFAVRLLLDYAGPGIEFYFQLISGKKEFPYFFMDALEIYCDTYRNKLGGTSL